MELDKQITLSKVFYEEPIEDEYAKSMAARKEMGKEKYSRKDAS